MADSRSRNRNRRGRTRRPVSGDLTDTVPGQAGAVGGRYRPLSDNQVQRIREAALEILESIGLSDAPAAVIDCVTGAGGRLSPGGRLQIPGPLVERTVAALSESGPVTLCGRDPAHDMDLADGRVHTGTGGAAPEILDLLTGSYRPSMLVDLFDAARLADSLRHIHFFSRSLVARDIADPLTLDVNTTYACLSGTMKHVAVSASHPAHVAEIARMCARVAGSPRSFRERPFLSLNVNHVAPPLRFADEACGVLMEAVRLGIPVHVNTFGLLGASSPVTMAGSLAQTAAETLAGIVLAGILDPGARVIFGARSMITDLRTGAMSSGGGEQALMTAATAQVARSFGLANSVIAGATDSKLADAQSGHEKALTVSLAAQAGANLITQGCGMQAGLMGVSFESYVIDNDMLGAVMRSLGPIEVDDATLGLGEISDVITGDGHFLGRTETLRRMDRDFLYPEISDRRTLEAWAASGREDIRAIANRRVRTILAEHFPVCLESSLRNRLRREFDIRLPESAERPQP
ncbi:MAG: trimethylamine methyltransferase family protein [Paracoccaceae bacterium]|nr:trimethylamine methyltransferase family protein [Paracoccaceae bacterium]